MDSIPSLATTDTLTTVSRLDTQFDRRLLGVPAGQVRLTWQITSTPSGEQRAYQVRTRIAAADWVENEPVPGAAQVAVPVGEALAARTAHEYSVRVASAYGWSAWSAAICVETGVAGADLEAIVVGIPSTVGGPVPVFRTEFDITSLDAPARLRISSLGVYDVRINGVDVTDGILNPGWTPYQERILVDTVDVGHALRPGRNAIAIRVADGWFRGRMGFAGRTEIYGSRIGAIAQVEVGLGSDVEIVAKTDATWRGALSGVSSASIYDGTVIDYRADSADPSVVGFDDAGWLPVSPVDGQASIFEPRAVPPVRTVDELGMAISIENEFTRLDAGQNISGWVRLEVAGRRGDRVVVRHAEVLEPDGRLHVAALRTARATDEYVLGADGVQTLEPVFTFHGFRYAEVSGAATVLSARAVAISSDLPARSRLTTSHATLNRFHENVRWSQRDNFVSLPTDCPQRDERLGWTGDAQAFAATSATLFDTRAFWVSWLRDLEIEQSDEFGVPSIVPNILVWGDMQAQNVPADTMGRAGWADAATIVPMAVYDAYGDVDVLRQQLSSMRRWVAHLRRRAGEAVLLPEEPFQYGDWLDPDAPGDKPWMAKVDALFVANAFYVNSLRLLARAERILGDADAAAENDALADLVASTVWQRWGAEAAQTQTGAAMCIQFHIVPPDERSDLGERLASEVRAARGRIATGFLGTPLVLDALSTTGHFEEALLMVVRRDAPSWLYQVDRGATTVWERWDAILPDGSIHAGEMGSKDGDSMISFNHYAYGAMIDWVYRVVAGLAPALPGYSRTRVAPRPSDDIRSVAVSIDTPYGGVALDWAVDDAGHLDATLTIPFGMTAELDLPVGPDSVVTVDGQTSTSPELRSGTHAIHVRNAVVASAARESV